ncbi:MAG TPA: SpoIIE family protein phosphatase [Acidimicrobiales bacterium]|nr:SpoIIE family protein phosphatase [Acidimicrobiales bacterium]
MTHGAAAPAPQDPDERFREMADAAPVLVWMSDRTGGCDWFNAVWLEFTGRSLAEELGDGWTEGVHPDDLDHCLTTYRAAFAAGEPFEMEYRLRHRDGSYRWVLDRGQPRRGADGELAGFIGCCIDIDDHRAAAADRERLLASEQVARAQAELVADRLSRLQTVTAALATALTVDDVVDVVIALAVQAAGATAGAVALRHADDDDLTLRRAVGYSAAHTARYATIPIDSGLPLAQAVRTGQPVIVGDVDHTPGLPAELLALAADTGCSAVATLPLLVEGRTTGAVALWFDTPQPFDAEQVAFLVAVATQGAAALERTRLWRSARVANDRLGFLAEASAAVATTLDRHEILDRVVRLAVPRLADWAVAHVPDGAHLRRVTLVHHDPDRLADIAAATAGLDPHLDDPRHPVAVTFRSGEPQLLTRLSPRVVAQLSADQRAALDRSGIHGGIAVPIAARGVTLAVLTFALADPDRRHTADDLAVATELAARAAVALENAALFEREHRIAEMLQRAVLPAELPAVDELDLAARYLPASAGLEVGGDWYDAFVLPDGRVGLVVGDVVGHGLQAAAVMGQVRNTLRGLALQGDAPEVVLGRLNEILLAPDGGNATVIYGVLDATTGELCWASAGHPPPVVVDAGRAELVASPGGPVLGAFRSDFERGSLVLPRRAALVLYTDGLVERRGELIDEGLVRLLEASGGAADADAAERCDRVVDELVGNHPRRDDVCVLVAQRR